MLPNATIYIKRWNELTADEINELNTNHKREWDIADMGIDKHKSNIFFLLKEDTGFILAQGQLVPIDGVTFDNKTYNIFGIGGIISNRQMHGYGKELVSHIKEYLTQSGKAGVGFIGLPEFYKRSGYLVSKDAKRFVYNHDGDRIINMEDDYICYVDGKDHFIQKVLDNPNKDVYLPREPNW